MSKIDTREWKFFCIGDLFPSIIKPPVFHSKDVVPSESGIPYVVRTKFNNGIKCRVAQTTKMCPSPAGVISFGAENASFFYQEEPFVSGRDIYYIDTRDITKNAALFLITCLQTISSKYSYSYGMFPECIKKDIIKLPATSEGYPDYMYMDNYMKEIIEESWTSLKKMIKLEKKGGVEGFFCRHSLDVAKWRYFHLYDENLFFIESGTKLDKVKMTHSNPSINFVGRANANNGVTDFIDEIPGLKPYDAGLLTISLGGEYLGSCFVQDKPFYTSQNVNVLIPRQKMSFYTKLFISTVIFREGRLHYKAFVDELNRHMKRDFAILLPSLPNGSPDFEYMDCFIKAQMNSVTSSLSMLKKIE